MPSEVNDYRKWLADWRRSRVVLRQQRAAVSHLPQIVASPSRLLPAIPTRRASLVSLK